MGSTEAPESLEFGVSETSELFLLSDTRIAGFVPFAAVRRARRAAGGRSAGYQRHRACAAVRLPLVRCATCLWTTQGALQRLRPLGHEGVWERVFVALAAAGGPAVEVLALKFLAAVQIAAVVCYWL
jgi:hypothetical protein